MNTSAANVSDTEVRKRALHPQESFLVQAPAGSGKTELLIQRYLRLLAVVAEPEEILAVTFTRKAAAEMRNRILQALDSAATTPEPEEDFKKVRHRLAVAALERDRHCDWQLNVHPSRLRIGTIDAVNTRLSRRTPLSAGFTSTHGIAQDLDSLYRLAAQQTIAMVEEDGATGTAVRQLLVHFYNQVDRLESLLANMLRRRDQWLRQTGAGHADQTALRRLLEASLAKLVNNSLVEAGGLISAELRVSMLELLSYAGCSLSVEQPGAPLTGWQDLSEFPEPNAVNLSLWRSLANVVLTAKGQWRKKLNKNQGFPADGQGMKASAHELLEKLADVPDLESALDKVRKLPDPVYKETQWAALESLLIVLPLAAANLKQVFADRRETDYSEIGQEALAAFGPEDEPTPLRLSWDYQVKHILLDEFQDTSRSQFDLLTKLTEGWAPNDGRSFFFVGDPMQSIYRFREAEVGLYLEAKKNGIGALKPTFLLLEANFRSDPVIVDWFNRIFRHVFPKQENQLTGAIGFSPSTAHRESDEEAGVFWAVVPWKDSEHEARKIVELVEMSQRRWPTESIGILVRSRRHVATIVQLLRSSGIAFTGTELETPEEQSVIQDLLALTRALTHLGDRLAWLAVLRAPWCGLSLTDLHALAAPDIERPLWEILRDEDLLEALSNPVRGRLATVRTHLDSGLKLLGKVSLRDCIEHTWLELGGPATLEDPADMEIADLYFDFLDTIDRGSDCADGASLIRQLRAHVMPREGPDARVEIMTMHKAKGLEFDTVILPGLGYTTKSSEKPLLLWHELAKAGAVSPLVFAPLKATGEDNDPLYEMLWNFDKEQEHLEQDRLLYVATTRTRKRLHLFAQLNRKETDGTISEPEKKSLLGHLWPAVREDIEVGDHVRLPERIRGRGRERVPEWVEISVQRLPFSWTAPAPQPAWRPLMTGDDKKNSARLEFDWAARWAKHVGSVVHRWLQQIAIDGAEHYDQERIEKLRPQFSRMLQRLGVDSLQLGDAVDRVAHALINVLTNERGRWILSSKHREAANEYPLTMIDGGQFKHFLLDRTFICEQGERWIIDYKTSAHEGGSLNAFLESETQRYRSQLRGYREAMAVFEQRPIRTALYFPLLNVFHEVKEEDRETPSL